MVIACGYCFVCLCNCFIGWFVDLMVMCVDCLLVLGLIVLVAGWVFIRYGEFVGVRHIVAIAVGCLFYV